MALGWMILIFILSSQSSIKVPDLFYQQDKALHLLLFSVLGFFWSLLLMSNGSRPTLWHVVLVSLLVMGYGGLDEFHQSFVPGRTPDILDLAADTTGGLLSALLMRYLLCRHVQQGPLSTFSST